MALVYIASTADSTHSTSVDTDRHLCGGWWRETTITVKKDHCCFSLYLCTSSSFFQTVLHSLNKPHICPCVASRFRSAGPIRLTWAFLPLLNKTVEETESSGLLEDIQRSQCEFSSQSHVCAEHLLLHSSSKQTQIMHKLH